MDTEVVGDGCVTGEGVETTGEGVDITGGGVGALGAGVVGAVDAVQCTGSNQEAEVVSEHGRIS